MKKLTFLLRSLKLSIIELLLNKGEYNMATTKLYQQDVNIKEWDATITKITENGIYLDRTAFFPEGGGQSCDLGTIAFAGALIDVTDVQEDGDDVVHSLSSTQGLTEGASVHCCLDWDRRFDNMQRHCGEHILSGIFYQECGGVNRGFHMGEDYMTIDISLEDEPTNPEMTRPTLIDRSMAARCELLANRVIWENTPVTVMRFETREEVADMPLRKALAFDEDISIVCVGSPENPADCVACCGTHPKTAGQVGLIKILKVENYKGMFRIFFEAGQRALADYHMKHDMLQEMSNDRSCSLEDLPEKIKGIEAKLADAKGSLAAIKKVLLSAEQQKLDAAIDASETTVVVHPLENLTMDDAFNLSKEYMGKPACKGRLIMLYCPEEKSYVLVSQGTPDCGTLVKEYAGFYGGKGGGRNLSARAIFTTEEDAALFAELLRKHLQ